MKRHFLCSVNFSSAFNNNTVCFICFLSSHRYFSLRTSCQTQCTGSISVSTWSAWTRELWLAFGTGGDAQECQQGYIYITFIYAFSRRFYPKRLNSAFRLYIFFYQYVCSLGIEPMTFCAANAMLYHWATGTPRDTQVRHALQQNIKTLSWRSVSIRVKEPLSLVLFRQ